MPTRSQGVPVAAAVEAEIAEAQQSDADDSQEGDEEVQSEGDEGDEEEEDSGSDGNGRESDDESIIENTMEDGEIPATAVRILLNSACRRVARKLARLKRKYSEDRYMEIERRQAERDGAGAAKRVRRRQRRHPRISMQFLNVVVTPDGRVRIHTSTTLEQTTEVKGATLLLAAALEHMVQGQQLKKLTASAGAAIAQQTARGTRQRHSRSMLQHVNTAGRIPSSSREPARKPPSVVLKEKAREVFRDSVRPLQQQELIDGASDTDAAMLKVCNGPAWRACKEDDCGCQQQCTALRRKTDWPADLPCVDPNHKSTNVDNHWNQAFLKFAKDSGWVPEAVQASQPARPIAPAQTLRLRGPEPRLPESAQPLTNTGVAALLRTQLGGALPVRHDTEALAVNDLVPPLQATGAAAADGNTGSAGEGIGSLPAIPLQATAMLAPAGNGPVRRGGRARQPSRRAVDSGSRSQQAQQSIDPFKDGMHPAQLDELLLVFGQDGEGQRMQQQVWEAWRGEASRDIVLIAEEHFEFTTLGTLYGPQHTLFWQHLSAQRQLFTDEAFAIVQTAIGQCSKEDAIVNAGVERSMAAPAADSEEVVLGEQDIQFPIKNPFGDLGLDFSGEYLLTSTGKEFPLLTEIELLLPAEENARVRALHTVQVAHFVMRITDRRVDAAVRMKVKGLEKFLQARQLMIDGRLQRLSTLHHRALLNVLLSRGCVVPSGTRFARLLDIADEYLEMCKKNLAAHLKSLKNLLSRLSRQT